MVGSPGRPEQVNGAEIQPYILRTDFPLERDGLATLVGERGADRRIVETLERLPARWYESPAEVLDGVRELDGGPQRTMLANDDAG